MPPNDSGSAVSWLPPRVSVVRAVRPPSHSGSAVSRLPSRSSVVRVVRRPETPAAPTGQGKPGSGRSGRYGSPGGCDLQLQPCRCSAPPATSLQIQTTRQIVATMLNGGTQHFLFRHETAASALEADRSPAAEPGCQSRVPGSHRGTSNAAAPAAVNTRQTAMNGRRGRPGVLAVVSRSEPGLTSTQWASSTRRQGSALTGKDRERRRTFGHPSVSQER
jgi:hypothetical protein